MSNQLYLESLIPEDPKSAENERSLEITQFPSVVGRAPECDLRIANPLVSRRHCYFFKRGDEIWVRDLDSHNGTHLNGEDVVREKPIHEGDRLDIGCLPYRVHESGKSRSARHDRSHGILESFMGHIVRGFQQPDRSSER
jgi:predicted component of type VI protein secretion system